MAERAQKREFGLVSSLKSDIDRRGFSMISAAAVLSAAGVRAVHAGSQEKIRVAFIGVGGRGGSNLKTIAKAPQVEVAYLCDVDARRVEAAKKLYPAAKTFRDFRDLYREDDFDAVVVSTCEHTHAYATLPALRRKKHVYCEKPLTHNVAEARLITQAAAKAGVATQMGTQIHAGENYRRVVELIQSEAIGKVREAHVWVGRAWGLQTEAAAKANRDIVHVTERPTEKVPVPDYLNWDLWLGPAKYRPYHPVYFPGPKWYRWWEFGNGTMSDLGSHWNDLPFWALKLDAPLAVTASGPEPHPEIAPASMMAEYDYGPRGDLPACKLTWHQGTSKPPQWQNKEIPQWNSGVLFVGDQGMLLSDYGKHVLLPEDDFVEFKRPEQFIANSPGQHEEWVQACLEGSPTGSPFSYAGPLTEANHLGNVAFRAGGYIEWDAAKMKVTNHEQANEYCSRTPRDGWRLE